MGVFRPLHDHDNQSGYDVTAPIESFDTPMHVEMFWPIVLQGDALASYNWLSGVVSLDVDASVWSDQDQQNPEFIEGYRAYIHEMFHAVQLFTLSFPYTWAQKLFEYIQPAVARHTGPVPNDFMSVQRIIQQGSACLTESETALVDFHQKLWAKAGPNGITAKSVLEGHAFFVERKYLYDLAEPHEWFQQIGAAPTLSYRCAFDYLVYVVGAQVAFDWFPLICAMALSTSDPGTAFERLAPILEATDDTIVAERSTRSARSIMAVCAQATVDLGVMTAVEGWNALGEGHRILHDSAVRLHREAPWEEIVDFYAFPEDYLHEAISHVRAPIILRPQPPHHLAVTFPAGMNRAEGLALFGVGAAGNQLCRSAAVEADDEEADVVARLQWLAQDHRPIEIQLSDEMLKSERPDAMIQWFADLPADAKMVMWGRCYFGLPAGMTKEQDEPLLTVPSARAVVRRLVESQPDFAIYLHPDLAFSDWFGSIVETADAEQPDPTTHEKLLTAARSAAYTIAVTGFRSRQNTGLIAERLTERFTRSPS